MALRVDGNPPPPRGGVGGGVSRPRDPPRGPLFGCQPREAPSLSRPLPGSILSFWGVNGGVSHGKIGFTGVRDPPFFGFRGQFWAGPQKVKPFLRGIFWVFWSGHTKIGHFSKKGQILRYFRLYGQKTPYFYKQK